MKAKRKNFEECSLQFEIEIPTEDVEKAFSEVYDEIMKVANIPGYRTGRAPRDIVEKYYSKDAENEVLKRVIPDSYRMAVEEHNIEPITYPEITDVVFTRGKPLSFKAKLETRPKFKVKEYLGLKAERKIAAISDEDVNKTLKNLQEMNAKYNAVSGRAAQKGDYIVSDLECTVDGKPAHKKRENLWICLEDGALVPELPEKMVGMNAGEERDIDAKLPDKYPAKELAGKSAKYHVLAKEIKVRQLPEINDEFAKDLGRDNLDDLKKEIRKELEEGAKANAEIEVENQVLKRLMDDNVFAVPQSFVKRQLDAMVEDAKRRLESKGFPRAELDKKNDEFVDKFKDDAVRNVRLLFILDAIAAQEKISVVKDDLNNAYKSISARTGKSEKEVKEYYEKEGFVDNLEEKIREEKTIKFLLGKAQITDKQ